MRGRARWLACLDLDEFLFSPRSDRLEPVLREFEEFPGVVVRWQGPRANGMPELHKLTPILGVLQDEGHAVALVTDGRMSGASGKVPAAIHVTPECLAGGPLAKVRTGDRIRLDAAAGVLQALVSEDELRRRGISVQEGLLRPRA